MIGGFSFIVFFLFYIVGTVHVFLSKRPFSRAKSLLAVSIFIGVPLLYHVCGRANYGHLAQGIHPMLIGLIAVVVSARINGRKIPAVMAMLLFVALTSIPVLFSAEVMTALQKVKGTVLGTGKFVRYEIDQNTFWVPKTQADSLILMTRFLSENMNSGDNILIAPYAPGLYCLLNKKAPIWDAYPLHLAPFDEQTRSIRDMESNNVNWALIDTWALDKIKDRSFPFTHELIWRYILREFDPVDCPGLSKSQILFRRRAKILTY